MELRGLSLLALVATIVILSGGCASSASRLLGLAPYVAYQSGHCEEAAYSYEWFLTCESYSGGVPLWAYPAYARYEGIGQ